MKDLTSYYIDKKSVALVFTSAECVIEFYGSVTELDYLEENIVDIIDFSETHKDAIVLRCTGWDSTNEYDAHAEWEIVDEYDFEIRDKVGATQ